MPDTTPLFRLPMPADTDPLADLYRVVRDLATATEYGLAAAGVAPGGYADAVTALAARLAPLEDPPICEVWRAGGTSLTFPAKARTLVPLQTVVMRSHPTMWSSAVPANIIVPKAGVYDVSATVIWPQMGQTDPESVYIEYGNGTTVKGGRRGRSGPGASPFYHEQTSTVSLPLLQGDWVRMFGENGATGAVTLPAENGAARLAVAWRRPLPSTYSQV